MVTVLSDLLMERLTEVVYFRSQNQHSLLRVWKWLCWLWSFSPYPALKIECICLSAFLLSSTGASQFPKAREWKRIFL
jgi:hypothetical protein